MRQIEHLNTKLTILVIILFVLVGLHTVEDYGMGWDEQVRWRSGDLKLQYYKDLLSGTDREIDRQLVNDRYPGLFDLPLAMFNAKFGGNRMIQGHILSILFGALGLGATGWLARIVFNDRAGFFAVLLLAILPIFYGHSMINPKDIPFLACYTLGLAYLVQISKWLVLNPAVPWRHFLLCGLAIGAAGASRVPGLVLIGFAAISWPAALLWGTRYYKRSINPVTAILFLGSGLVATSLAAMLTVLVFFPRAQLQLLSGLPDVAYELHSSAAELPLLYAGKLMNAADGPITYAHGFFLISTPLWMILLMVVGIAAVVKWILKGPSHSPVSFFLQILFALTGAFPWLYILVTHPALHDGMRHMLFAVPPLVILMATGILSIHSRIRLTNPAATKLAGGMLTAFVLLQLFNLWKMHPYQYVSFNLLAGNPATLPERYETEYWCTSSKHLLEALPVVTGIEPASVVASNRMVNIRISGALDSAREFVPSGYQLVDSFEEADYYLANTYLRSDLYAEGEVIYQIERGGIPIGVIKRLK